MCLCITLILPWIEATFVILYVILYVDGSMFVHHTCLFVQVLDPSFREPYPNVNRWFTTCINQPQFKSVLGEVKLCEKMATFDGKNIDSLLKK